MPWVKLDDQFLTHPKALAAGKNGRALFIAGLCYSAGQLTDGAIPRTTLPLIAAAAEVPGPATARRLVEVGLWHATDGGWEIHDYHDHQPHAEDVKAHREEVSRARSEAGKRGAAKRWGHGKADGKQDGKADGKTDGQGSAEGADSPLTRASDPFSVDAPQNENPHVRGPGAWQTDGKAIAPSPYPYPSSSSSPPQQSPPDPPTVAGAGAPTEEDRPPNPETTAEAAIAHMARCDLERAKAEGTPIRSKLAYLAKLTETRREDHGAELLTRARNQPGVDPVDLAEQLDPTCGPLDGGTARADARWAQAQADVAEGQRAKAQAMADQVNSHRILELLTVEQLRALEADARAELADGSPDALVHRHVRTLALLRHADLLEDHAS